MSDGERSCEEHGAMSVEWHVADIDDNEDGTPRCFFCEIEADLAFTKRKRDKIWDALKRQTKRMVKVDKQNARLTEELTRLKSLQENGE